MADSATGAVAADPILESSEPSAPGAEERTLADLLVPVYALVLSVLFVPSLLYPFSTPRLVALCIAGAAGAVVLVRLAVWRDRSALWLSAFLAWAALTALVSHDPIESALGFLGERWSVLGYVALAGSWAIGRLVTPAGERLLRGALALGIGINVLIAIIQSMTQPVGPLGLMFGRAAGLAPNPIVLGGLVTGALAMVGWMAATQRSRLAVAAALAAILGLVGGLSGSRASIAMGIVLVVLPVLLGRARPTSAGLGVPDRSDDAFATDEEQPVGEARTIDEEQAVDDRPPMAGRVGRAAVLAVAVLVGMFLATGFDTTSTVNRTEGSAESGIRPRLDMWEAGVRSYGERPLVGWGPGQFVRATSSQTTAAFVRAEGPDAQFYDAHNLVIELLVATGVVGLVLAAGFVVSAARLARGQLAWFALGVASSLLLTPMFVMSGALIFVALGASMARSGVPWARLGDPEHASPPRSRGAAWIAATSVVAVLGLLLGVSFARADLLAYRGQENLDPNDLAAAQRFVVPDLELANIERRLRVAAVNENSTPEARAAALRSAHHLLDIAPSNHFAWAIVGVTEMYYGEGTREERRTAAQPYFEEALRLNPWSVTATNGMFRIADARRDQAGVEKWTKRLCEVDLCPNP